MIRDFVPEDFDRVFEIIEKSFPRDEHGTYEEHKKLLSDPAYKIYILADDESRAIKGFMSIWDLEKAAHIDHFAMAPEFRNGGNGGKMLQDMLKHLDKMITLEAEPPENEMAVRRIGFYKRNGFFLNEYPYLQPAISKGGNEVPLLIMTYGRNITKEEFEALREVLYRIVYKRKPKEIADIIGRTEKP